MADRSSKIANKNQSHFTFASVQNTPFHSGSAFFSQSIRGTAVSGSPRELQNQKLPRNSSTPAIRTMPTVVERRSSAQLDWADFDPLNTSFKEEAPLSDAIRNLKAKALLEAYDAGQLDVVVEYSRTTEGLVNSALRSRIWPFLFGMLPSQETGVLGFTESHVFGTMDLPPHKDEDQIMLDIRRLFTVMSHFHSFNHVVNSSYTTIYSKEDIEAMRKRLFSLIVRVLRKYPCLNYYQGYHDVASVILLVCNGETASDEVAFLLLEKLTVCHLRDFMIADIGLSISHLKLIPAIVEEVDPTLFELIRHTSNSYLASNGCYFDYKFFQALLSILTMFSHDVSNFSHLLVMWDFFFSYNSVAANLYVYVACMLHFKDDILRKLNVADGNFHAVDPDLVHTLLSPTDLFAGITDASLVRILNTAKTLIEHHPLDSLAADTWFREFNTSSVLLTSSCLASPRDGFHHLFDNDVLEALIRKQEDEQRRETLHETELFHTALEQESLATSVNSLDEDFRGSSASRVTLLSSSLSSLTAASSSINHKLVNTSSLFFRKLFSHSDPDDENPGKAVSRRNKDTHLLANLYKISFTIGFIGFMLHFLVKHSSYQNTGVYRFFHSELAPLRTSLLSMVTRNSLSVTSEIGSVGKGIATEVVGRIGDFVTYIKDSEVVNLGLDFGQVGLGTLRNSIYAFGD